MTVQQSATGITFGLASGAPGAATIALNAAANWATFGFIPSASDTVNTIRLYLSSVTGSLAASDLTCDIFSDSPGVPGSSLGSVSLGTALTNANNGTWQTFSGLSVSVTANTQYWIVLKNANALQSSNFARWQYISQISNGPLNGFGSATRAYGQTAMNTTNSGTSWVNLGVGICNFRVGFSSGAYQGFPAGVFSGDSTACFSTNEAGVKFVLPGPSNLTYNIAGIAFPVTSVGTPTANPLFRLYTGTSTTPTASTQNVVVTKSLINSNEWLYGYFSTTQQVAGGTTIRLTLADPSDVSGSNCYKVGQAFTVDSDANSLALMPFADGGSQGMQKTALASGAWTDTNTIILAFDLLFDSTGELTATGSGGNVGEEGGLLNILPQWW